MKKLVALAALVMVALPATGANAAGIKTVESNNIFASGSDANGGANVFGNAYTESVVGGATTAVDINCVSLYITTPYSSNDGCGPLTKTFDPTFSAGTMSGTIPGRYGPIVVNLTYTRTTVSTSSPYAALEVVPGTSPQTSTYASLTSVGRISGTLTTATGVVTLTNAYASLTMFRQVSIHA